jgi:DNA-binding NtrC family response regulator
MPQNEEVRLLLVDDDPPIQRAYGSALEHCGVTVETASTGREATERVRAGSFDVIVSDISMPDMTGLDFLKVVRAYDREVPVIVITDEPGLDSAIKAVECGAFRYLGKPVEARELCEIVIRAARIHRMKKQVATLKYGSRPKDPILVPGRGLALRSGARGQSDKRGTGMRKR